MYKYIRYYKTYSGGARSLDSTRPRSYNLSRAPERKRGQGLPETFSFFKGSQLERSQTPAAFKDVIA